MKMLYIYKKKQIIETAVTKKQTTFRFESDVLSRLKVSAKNENRSVNNFVENYLKDLLSKIPNATTLAAIEEAKTGTSTERIDMSSFEAIMKSHEE